MNQNDIVILKDNIEINISKPDFNIEKFCYAYSIFFGYNYDEIFEETNKILLVKSNVG